MGEEAAAANQAAGASAAAIELLRAQIAQLRAQFKEAGQGCIQGGDSGGGCGRTDCGGI
jgi:hypothetical protein